MPGKLPSAEAYFVRTFVSADRRSRVALELSDPDRRDSCLLSFSEPPKGRLRASRLHLLQEGISVADALDALAQRGCTLSESVHIIHLARDVDGHVLPLKRALNELWLRGPAVLINEAKGIAFLMLDTGGTATSKAIMYM